MRQFRYLQAMTEPAKTSSDTYDVQLGRSHQPTPCYTDGLHYFERIGCMVPSLSCSDRTFADAGCSACKFGVA
jgi:hypothetical protein